MNNQQSAKFAAKLQNLKSNDSRCSLDFEDTLKTYIKSETNGEDNDLHKSSVNIDLGKFGDD